jgi:hypothetical protein
MIPSSRVCPHCQQPLTADERYCRQCHMYFPEPHQNTNTAFPPPPPYGDLINPNWTRPGITQGHPGEKLSISRRYSPASREPKKLLLIGGIFLVCLLLVGAGSFWMGRSSSTAQDQALTTPSVSNATSPARIPAASTPVPTATSLTTPQPAGTQTVAAGTITRNVQLTCSGCDDPILIKILTITFDPADGRMIWAVTLHNVSGVEQRALYVNFTLQDPPGKSFLGTGPANAPFDAITLTSGQILNLQEIFTFVPIHGVAYTLTAKLNSNNSTPDITFDPVQITF